MKTRNANEIKAVLYAWRTKILNRFLTIAAIVASVGTVITILTSRPDQRTELIIFLILTLILIVLASLRKIDIRIRTWSTLLVAYIVGLATLLSYGLGGSGSLYLLALPIVALVLLGVRSGILVSIISVITMVVFVSLDLRALPENVNDQSFISLADRLAGSIDMLILLTITMVLLVMFYRFQEHLILKEHQVQANLKSLERELEIGRNIQQDFLPSKLPEVNGWEIAAHFKATREVAGDFYDIFLLPDGNLLYTIGDVCDKGVGAALFMTLFRSLIRVMATSNIACSGNDIASLTPAERLSHIIPFINYYIAHIHGDANKFATIFIGIFELQNNRFTYMNCGHEPPLLVKEDGSVTPLPRTGPVVGLMPRVKFSVKEVTFEMNDLLLAFTDGVPDASNPDNERFGMKRLLEIVKSSNISPSTLLQRIDEKVHKFIGVANQFDDIALLAIKRDG